jgi:predicted  nucleic acid-binding Zn-ribbon protein
MARSKETRTADNDRLITSARAVIAAWWTCSGYHDTGTGWRHMDGPMAALREAVKEAAGRPVATSSPSRPSPVVPGSKPVPQDREQALEHRLEMALEDIARGKEEITRLLAAVDHLQRALNARDAEVLDLKADLTAATKSATWANETSEKLKAELADAVAEISALRPRFQAWYAVMEILEKLAPGWSGDVINGKKSLSECAVQAVHVIVAERDVAQAEVDTLEAELSAATDRSRPPEPDPAEGDPRIDPYLTQRLAALESRVELMGEQFAEFKREVDEASKSTFERHRNAVKAILEVSGNLDKFTQATTAVRKKGGRRG